MLLWIKAVLLTLWHGIKYIAIYALAAVAGHYLATVIPREYGLLLMVVIVAAIVLVIAACFIWLFVSCVRDNHERLQTKAWLEESARGGDGA